MKPFGQSSTMMGTIVGVPCGAFFGTVIGFCVATAKMLGDAEVYPASQIPVAPDLLTYVCVGLAVGVTVTPLLFAVSWLGLRMIRDYRNSPNI